MSSVTLPLLSAPIAAVVAVAVYHLGFVRPQLRRLDAILSGEASLGDAAAAEVRERGLQGAFAKRTEERLLELERLAGRDVYRVGFVRYNSFADVGSDLSFALALLNREGDGAVVSSIYSREETRTFGKAVRKFVPQHDASKEEQQAIAMARTGVGN
ncbi:MAG: DUF4446 family protein [Candidatus Eremiobacteraeota bacterium]|nr:DUF4446 family protein [Candidatus Eremiobacteraeota bacterium]